MVGRVALACCLALLAAGCAESQQAWDDLVSYVEGDPSTWSDDGSLEAMASAAAPAAGQPDMAMTADMTVTYDEAVDPGWSYGGGDGPERWATLDRAWSLCGDGASQSPIDVGRSAESELPAIAFHYRAGPLVVENTGRGLRALAPPGGWASFDGQRYELIAVDFRTPAEHRVGGVAPPMEIQFVHENLHRQKAVVGVFVQEGRRNPAFADIRDYAPDRPGRAEPEDVAFDPMSLLPDEANHVRYSGSLTTPPCSEAVAWRVMLQPLQASAGTLTVMREIMGANARPIQALNARRPIHN